MDPPSPSERNASDNITLPAVCRVDGCIVCEVGRRPIASDFLNNVSWTSILKLVLAILHYAAKDTHKYFSNHDITNFVCVHWLEISGSKEWTLEYKSRVSDCLSHNPKCFESSERGKWRLHDKSLVQTLIVKFKKAANFKATSPPTTPSSPSAAPHRHSKRSSSGHKSPPEASSSKRQRVAKEEGSMEATNNCDSPSNIFESMRNYSFESISPSLSLSSSYVPSPFNMHQPPVIVPDIPDQPKISASPRFNFCISVPERIVPSTPPSPTEISPRTPPLYYSPTSPLHNYCQPPSPPTRYLHHACYVSPPSKAPPSRQLSSSLPTLLPSVTELLYFSNHDNDSSRRLGFRFDRDMVDMFSKQRPTLS